MEGLDQQQVAVAVDGQTRPFFAAAVEQAVGIGVFFVQVRSEAAGRRSGLQKSG